MELGIQKNHLISIKLRFYEELNDFLPLENRKITFEHFAAPKTAIKDVIESLGVPHTEIDLILINGKSVDFSYQVQHGDYISIYPVFEKFDIGEVTRLRPKPLRIIQFILDVHLGKLTRFLRLLGFDTAYSNNYSDKNIVLDSVEQKRIILTRDIGLLKHKEVTHGYWVRNTNPNFQITEILNHFDLHKSCQPFTRCLECNGIIEKVAKENIIQQLLPKTKNYFTNFSLCTACHKVYWQGSHYQKLKNWVETILKKRA